MIKFDNILRNYWLYVLLYEEGKYYIGVASILPEKRMQQHMDGHKSAYWTQKYKPIKLLAKKDLGVITYAQAEIYENKEVRSYMKQRGCNNVRGGDLTDVEPYAARFGRLIVEDDWRVATVITLLVLIIIYLELKIYIWK